VVLFLDKFIGVFIAVIVILLCPSLLWAQPILIKAEPLSKLAIVVNRSVPAKVLSLRKATIASELTSNVISLPIMVGDQLNPGQRVGKLDCTDNELNLKRAQAELSALNANRKLAKQQLEQLQKLQKNRNTSEDQINQKLAQLSVVESKINAGEISIQIAKGQIEKCLIISPFKGVVTDVKSTEGSFTTLGTPIFSLIDIENVELAATMTSVQLNQINKTNQSFFLFEEQTYPVKIRTVLPVVDTHTQTHIVRLTFTDQWPLPGANGRLQWVLSGNIIPASLIVYRDGKNGVFTVEQTQTDQLRAKFIAVHNIQQGQIALVDIPESTLLVTDGRFSLADGDQIVLQ